GNTKIIKKIVLAFGTAGLFKRNALSDGSETLDRDDNNIYIAQLDQLAATQSPSLSIMILNKLLTLLYLALCPLGILFFLMMNLLVQAWWLQEHQVLVLTVFIGVRLACDLLAYFLRHTERPITVEVE
ncbi:hypothetical protein ACJX0J_023482, partial [Zea mays]